MTPDAAGRPEWAASLWAAHTKEEREEMVMVALTMIERWSAPEILSAVSRLATLRAAQQGEVYEVLSCRQWTNGLGGCGIDLQLRGDLAHHARQSRVRITRVEEGA